MRADCRFHPTRYILLSLLAVLFLTLPLIAQDHGTDHAADADPDIFAGDFGTAVFTVVIFIVLLLILGRWAWGPILKALQKREEHITQSIANAEKAQAQAETTLADYQEKLAQAQQEAQTIIEQGRAEAVKLAEQLQHQARSEAEELRRRATRDITLARDQALKELYQQTIELSTELAGQILKKNITPADHQALLQESLHKLQEKNINARN